MKLKAVYLLGRLFILSPEVMVDSIKASDAQIATVSLRRQNPAHGGGNDFWNLIKSLPIKVLPNTAGCHSVKEAVTTAEMARELFDTHWIKLEVIGDEYNLQPDPFGLLEATKELIAQGFEVFPYTTDDSCCMREAG